MSPPLRFASSTSWRPRQAKAFTYEANFPRGGHAPKAVGGPSRIIGQGSAHNGRHGQGDAEDGHPFIAVPLVGGHGIHEPHVDVEHRLKHLLYLRPIAQVGPDLDTDPSPFRAMSLRRSGHAPPFQAALDDRSPRTLKGRASVEGAMDTEVEQEAPLTIIGLIRTLTARATLPHLLGFFALVVALFLVVGGSRDLEVESAAAFVGMGLAYAGVAMLAEQPTVRGWVVAEKGGAPWTLLTVLLAPVALGAVLAGVLLTAVEGAGVGSTLPIALAALFVAWSIGQGRSFRSAVVRWPTSNLTAAPRAPPGGLATTVRLGIMATLLVAVLLVQGALAGTSILTASVSLFDVLLDQIGLAAGLVVLVVVGEFLTAEGRRACGSDTWTSRMFGRWHVLAVVFAAWHLGTAWRHITSEQPQVATAVEEIVLMIVTVVMAVWSMTSKSSGSELGLVRRSNALFWGLAFGYAYAGSVAMLSTVVAGVSGVLFLGHVVVALTLLALLRSTGPALASRHAKAMEHAAMGARLSERLEEQAASAVEEDEVATPQTEEETAPLAEAIPAAAQNDVIEVVD